MRKSFRKNLKRQEQRSNLNKLGLNKISMTVVLNKYNRPKALPSVKGGVFGLIFMVFSIRVMQNIFSFRK